MAADYEPVTALMAALDREGLAPLAVAVSSLKDPAIAAELDALIETQRPAVILNTTAFSAMREDDTTVLDAADVPVLQVVLSGSAREAWSESGRGLSPADLAMNVVLPELDGRLLTRAISFKAEAPTDPRLEFASVRHQSEPDRVDYVARLAAAWARLGRKPPAERQLALMLSRLSRARRPHRLRRRPRHDGERARDPAAAEGRRLRHRRQGLDRPPTSAPCSTARSPICDAATSSCCCSPIAARPTTTPRPSRVADYVAVYAWLRDDEKIDALVHLGTHGTLEWLPGKALALSADVLARDGAGPLPVIYPFIVNNPGEAVQAKRRLAAVTIGHLTPPLSAAGLHGPLAELEGLIEEYAAADGLDCAPPALSRRGDRRARLDAAGWPPTAAWCAARPTHAAIAKLDAQLCDIKDLAIRDSLHVFGRAPDETFKPARSASAPGCWPRSTAGACAPGPAGAPSRGRPDVLPTGRNLTSIDPRAIPTRTAAAIGGRAADEVVRRYLQDHGDHPRALVIDLWASASLRTGGDDLAQALAYLGVRPVWDKQSNRVTGIEVMPLATLDRPRIDVTLRISGLFRDIFESQIALFDLAVRTRRRPRRGRCRQSARDAARRRGDDLARVFGGAPGSYGAQAGRPGARRRLADARGPRPGLSRGRDARLWRQPTCSAPAGDGFRASVSTADVLVHPQDDRERDLLDGDGVADFAGGFAAAAAMLGNTPELYHLDTSQPETPKARRIAEEIARVVRGRLTNPRWIAGMLAHGHRGVAEIAQGVDALYAFAATADAVPGHLFDATHAALIADEAVLAAMLDKNPRGDGGDRGPAARRARSRPVGHAAQFGRARSSTAAMKRARA